MSLTDHHFDCPREDCTGQVYVEFEVEPADPSYGADADGNRGMYVPASISHLGDPSDLDCSEHGKLTEAECAEVMAKVEQYERDWSPSDDEPDPYDYDDYDSWSVRDIND